MTDSLPATDSLQPQSALEVPASVFRAYDIRGVVDEQLTDQSVRLISRAIGTKAIAYGIDTLYVGFDGRLSSPILSESLIEGLREAGCTVVSLGLIPTPLLYFATSTTDINSGVMLTASHNPANYNGLKIVFNNTCLADNQIQKIRLRTAEQSFASGQGTLSNIEIDGPYINEVCDQIRLAKPMKVVVDCGNAVPSKIAPELFSRIGCDVIKLFCDIDGRFPNHHPDPTVSDNLRSLVSAVIDHNADLGIAFDGDGDRLGLVTNLGEEVNADKMLMLLAEELAPSYQDEAVVFDVKCSKSLETLISELGMRPVMHRSGHSFMKQKMQETNAPLGGEYAAHVFLNDKWYGFDDGMYTAARIVEILSRRNASSSEVFAQFSVPFSTQEIKLPIDEENKFGLMAKIIEIADFPDGKCIKLDGLRVEFAEGWGLVRASNTSPALLLRFEAESEASLEHIIGRFKALITAADNSIEFDF